MKGAAAAALALRTHTSYIDGMRLDGGVAALELLRRLALMREYRRTAVPQLLQLLKAPYLSCGYQYSNTSGREPLIMAKLSLECAILESNYVFRSQIQVKGQSQGSKHQATILAEQIESTIRRYVRNYTK